eukprot:195690-Chlamydomonas_euryale.AAC.1
MGRDPGRISSWQPSCSGYASQPGGRAVPSFGGGGSASGRVVSVATCWSRGRGFDSCVPHRYSPV